ncbi:ribonuclease H2 subunit C-like [Amphiura filiformis]|uniref:ribonuclease H2 subunit C-like n=1 Tax=Amphiura filiformis TaxID=82378 RepID=UPI003B2188CD
MSIHVNKNSLLEPEECECHLIPATIEHDSSANVAQFFTTTKKKMRLIQTIEMTATFRGRQLQGQSVQVPEGYTGLVLKEPNKPFTEDEDRTFRATHQFKNFTYWNLETATCANDAIVKSMVWPQIAQAIHEPVEIKKTNGSS